ncbi:unnamed protein product, partial [marine sediment metagenome]
DAEEEIVSLASTEEEPKRITKIMIVDEPDQDGFLTGYLEREKIMDSCPLFVETFGGIRRDYPIELDIPVGETFVLKGKNKASATYLSASGFVEYEIIR